MQVSPKTDRELATANLFPAGEYDFEVVDAKDTVSKAGNDMIVLNLRVYDGMGSSRFVYDYLLDQMAYKVKHAAEACGLLKDYESGKLDAASFVGKTGRVKLTIQASKDPQYDDKNVVKDYVVKLEEKPQGTTSDLEDSIPW